MAHIPDTRISDIAAIVIGNGEGVFSEELTVGVDSQDLLPDEKIWINSEEFPTEQSDQWRTAPRSGEGLEGAIRGALQSSSSSWLLFLQPGQPMDPGMLARLNQIMVSSSAKVGCYFFDVRDGDQDLGATASAAALLSRWQQRFHGSNACPPVAVLRDLLEAMLADGRLRPESDLAELPGLSSPFGWASVAVPEGLGDRHPWR
jgi:hypothetical protein